MAKSKKKVEDVLEKTKKSEPKVSEPKITTDGVGAKTAVDVDVEVVSENETERVIRVWDKVFKQKIG